MIMICIATDPYPKHDAPRGICDWVFAFVIKDKKSNTIIRF